MEGEQHRTQLNRRPENSMKQKKYSKRMRHSFSLKQQTDKETEREREHSIESLPILVNLVKSLPNWPCTQLRAFSGIFRLVFAKFFFIFYAFFGLCFCSFSLYLWYSLHKSNATANASETNGTYAAHNSD